MVKRIIFLLSCFLPLSLCAQRQMPPSAVSMVVGDSVFQITPVITQSEFKPGWKIIDIQTNGKMTRYLWGKHSHQYADDQRPRLVIRAGQNKLTDFVLIRLKEKKEYRKFPSHNMYECDFRRLDLELVEVKIMDDDVYEVHFHENLPPGEYVITNLRSDAVNDSGDVEVYPFTITRQ